MCVKENDLPAFRLLTCWSAGRGPRWPAPRAAICPHPPPPALLAWPRYLTPTCPHGQWSLRGWEPDRRPLGPPQQVVCRGRWGRWGRWGRQRVPWRAECSRRDATSLLLCNKKQARAHLWAWAPRHRPWGSAESPAARGPARHPSWDLSPWPAVGLGLWAKLGCQPPTCQVSKGQRPNRSPEAVVSAAAYLNWRWGEKRGSGQFALWAVHTHALLS